MSHQMAVRVDKSDIGSIVGCLRDGRDMLLVADCDLGEGRN